MYQYPLVYMNARITKNLCSNSIRQDPKERPYCSAVRDESEEVGRKAGRYGEMHAAWNRDAETGSGDGNKSKRQQQHSEWWRENTSLKKLGAMLARDLAQFYNTRSNFQQVKQTAICSHILVCSREGHTGCSDNMRFGKGVLCMHHEIVWLLSISCRGLMYVTVCLRRDFMQSIQVLT